MEFDRTKRLHKTSDAMSTPNPEEEVERLSQIIENLNFVNANQAQELSMKSGHLAHAKEIYQKAARDRDRMAGLLAQISRVLGVNIPAIEIASNPDHGAADLMSGGINMDLNRLIQERDDLRAWKDSAMKQLRKLDTQAIGKLLGLPLGIDVMSAIEPAIKDLIAEKEALRSGCLSDPLLKSTVDPLFKEIEELKIQLANLNAEIEECRDNILHERHQLEGGVLDSDQVNAVLGVFDDSITQPVAFVCNSCNARVGKVTNGDCDVCLFEGPRATPAAPVVYDCVCGTCKKPFTSRVKDATMCDDCCPF